MAFLDIKSVKIAGMSACVPKTIEENNELSILSAEEAGRLIASTGIERKRKAGKGVCASDMCHRAAAALIEELGWEKDEIECLVFVSQTPDYYLPPTSCILQDRLGLSRNCYTLDVSLGCSGWVYGLSTICALLAGGNMKKGLLLAGDTSFMNSPGDKSTYPLFGDAGTATAIEFDPLAGGLRFSLGTDGSGYEAIIIPDGGARNPANIHSFDMEQAEPGIERCRLNTILEGMDVFSFGMSRVPEAVEQTLAHYVIDKDVVDYFVFHQANLFLNEKIRKKLQLPEEKVPYSLRNFGNTSSATIPLTMITELGQEMRNGNLNFVACGFGVGLSWGTVVFRTDRIVVPHLIEI